MIARQRENLVRSFAIQDQSPVSRDVSSTLHEAQSSLLEQTVEFADGMSQRGGPMPQLDAAIQSMESAVGALAEPHLPRAVAAEQQALAALIRARENVRKLLSQTSSSSASACRNFDRQQRQKLRMPERKSDPQQELAKRRAQLDDLAKRERAWSQTARQSCENPVNSALANSASSSGATGSPPTTKASPLDQPPSQGAESTDSQSREQSQSAGLVARAEAAQEQQALMDELRDIQRELDQLAAAGDVSRRQTERATGSMKQGLEALNRQEGQKAGLEGERAAEQIEQLASHLASMHAQDFGKRLEQAQQSAQQLASRQSDLESRLVNPSGSTADASATAREQQDLATRVELLGELLSSLRRDAVAEPGNTKSRLDQMEVENPTGAIAEAMRQAAQILESQRHRQAMKNVNQASERLDELSNSLAQVRSDYATPQLKELMAIEEQLAQLMQQARRASAGKEPPTTMRQQWERLDVRLDKLAASDARLAEAMRQVREGSRPGNAGLVSESRVLPAQYQEGQERQSSDGHFSLLGLGSFHGRDAIARVLQTKIQEAILAAALVDANQPVPPEYKELVERYYRALSDDLR